MPTTDDREKRRDFFIEFHEKTRTRGEKEEKRTSFRKIGRETC